jgi:hypothetical protein
MAWKFLGPPPPPSGWLKGDFGFRAVVSVSPLDFEKSDDDVRRVRLRRLPFAGHALEGSAFPGLQIGRPILPRGREPFATLVSRRVRRLPQCERRCALRYPDIVATQFDLAGVHPGTEVETRRAHFIAQVCRATERSAGAVEGCQHPVAGALDVTTGVAHDGARREFIVTVHDTTQFRVTEAGGEVRRPD